MHDFYISPLYSKFDAIEIDAFRLTIFRIFPQYWITYSSLILLSRKFSFHIRLHFNPILHNSKKFECIYGTCDKIQQKEIMYSVSILIGL